MTLIFWQNIVSPHQFPYQEALSKFSEVDRVIIIAHSNVSSQRQNMGWEQNTLKDSQKLKFFINPNKSEIEGLFSKYNVGNHFFTGIRFNPMVHLAFKVSLKFDVKRHLLAEGPFTYRKPVFLHTLKTYMLDYGYFKKIDKVYAIGTQAVSWYPKFGFKKNQIVPFMYVVNQIENDLKPINNKNLKILFVGQLIKRKGVDILLKALSQSHKDFELDIIGDGLERGNLERLAKKLYLEHRIKFQGTKDNTAIRKAYSEYDILILPSRHDGWGAVINEALMAGLFVICSDNCGSQELIQDKKNGLIFESDNAESLQKAMAYCIENKPLIRKNKLKIKNWSHNISPTEVAQYLMETLTSKSLTSPPWKNTM